MKTFRNRSRRHLHTAFFIAVAPAFLLLPSIRAAAQAPAPCCFTNPAYSGICVVKPSDQETCKTILDYLNNPHSSGKTYCGGTTIRGGWKETKCPQTSDPKRDPDTLQGRNGGRSCEAPCPMAAQIVK